jgi:cysteine desulfurase/selenocysteine lyase
MAEYDKLPEKTKIVATIHISNALGTINPIKYMIDQAHLWSSCFDRWAQAVPFKTQHARVRLYFYVFRT